MRRQANILLAVAWLIVNMTLLTPITRTWGATVEGTLKSVTLSENPGGTELDLNVDGNYDYKAVQSSSGTVFIDLAGVKADGVDRSQQWANPMVAGYRLMAFLNASGQPVVRVAMEVKQPTPYVVHKDGSKLRLVLGNGHNVSAATAPVTAANPDAPAVHPVPAEHASGLLVVSNVTLDKHDSGETFVEVATSRTASYRVMTLRNPARLVVDIDGAATTSPQKSYQADTAVLKDIRIGQFSAKDPSVVRVVADLKGDPVFDVHATPAGIRIELHLRGPAKAMPIATATPVPQPKPVEPKAVQAAISEPPPVTVAKPAPPAQFPEVIERKATVATLPLEMFTRDVAKPNVQSQSPAITQSQQVETATPPSEPLTADATIPVIQTPSPATTNAQQVATLAPPAQQVALNVKNAVIPTSTPKSTTTQQAATVTSQPPAQPVTLDAAKLDVQSTLPPSIRSTQVAAAPLPPPASATPEALRAEQAAQTLAPGNDNSPSAAAPAQGVPPATTATPSDDSKPVYTGEPISLNLKDVDLKDFFRLIHEISGLNIIIDPNVTGSVTLVLDSVPWDQALDIVMKNNGLGKVLEGNVLRIARLQTLTAEQEGVTKLASARMDAAPLVTVFRPVNYAKASEIATLLKTWTGGGALTRRGIVMVDLRGNTLIISDVQAQIPVILNIISKIDRKAKQISIEARVVLANADFTRTLSSALSGSVANQSGSTLGGGGTGANTSITPTNTIPSTTPPLSSLTIPPNASTGFGAIAITNASSRYLINAVISAQEERDHAKTISRPTIVTQNNVQGMVQQGVQVPIQTTINNTISVQYYAATLQLTVTPQVTDDNNIFLIINVLNNSVGASISGVGPEINTQQATTSVLVPDGGTVVFGGITVTSRSKSATYVPWLGTIPIIGNLFKTSNIQDQDQELLFFVSPKVLPG
jgi:type IV pilus assembly protein PilQ